MNVDFALGSSPLLSSLGDFSTPLHPMLRVLDQFSPSAPLGRGFCVHDSSIRSRLLPASRLVPKWREPGASGIAPVSWREKLLRGVSHDVRTGSVFLTPASTGAIVCQCSRGGENSGRFEDCEMGSFADPSLNCKGDKKCAGNGSGRSSMDFDARDSLRSRPWNGTGDGPCFLHHHSDSAKELGWASSYCPAASFTPAWDDRVMSCSGFNAVGQILLRHKATTAGIPMSLRMLKRKQVQNRALMREGNLQQAPDDAWKSHGCLAMAEESTYCSFKKAFSTMVFMIRTLQSHTIQLRKGVFYEDLQEVLALVHRELNSSLVLLFQQVFACTPKLMLAVMLLLANYTVYSMGNHVALGAVLPPPPLELASFEMSPIEGLFTDASQDSVMMSKSSAVAMSAQVEARNHESRDSWPSTQTKVSGAGGTNGSIVSIPACSVGPFESGGHASRNRDLNSEGEPDEAEVVGSQAKELAPGSLILHPELKKIMVAPVHAKLAPDDYSCYDRTELIYQHAIGSDSTNALLLVNYAQFLYLVRRDHDRAEQLFTRAIKADPTDGHIISHFASFLWAACGDRLAAEKAYRTLVDLDPSNPYFTGCLANFMWHAGECTSCNITQQSDRMKGVTDEDFS